MAVNEAPIVPGQFKYGIAQQAAFGTAIADNAAFLQLDCEPVTIGYDVKTLENPQSTGSRKARDSGLIVHTNRSAPVFTITGYALPEYIDHILAAMFQNVTEGATTPYDKAFAFADGQPAFVADAGYFYTFIKYDPAASKSIKVVDCICRKLTFSIEEGMPLKYTAEFIGRGVPSSTADPSGTWTRGTAADMWFFEAIDRVTIDHGSSESFHMKSAELTFAWNTIELIGQDGSSSFNDYGLADLTNEFKVKVIKDADYHDLLAAWVAGTVCSFNIGWGHATPGTDDNDMDFTFRGKITETDPNYDAIVAGELTGVMTENDAGAVEPVTITMANAIDRSW